MNSTTLQEVLERVGLVSRFYYYAELDSTMKRAREICQGSRNGFHHGSLILADYQTAGRGRNGRNWNSPAGKGLLFTLIVSRDFFSSGSPENSLSVAACGFPVCLCHGLRNFVPDARIKFPNDIVAGGRKIAGLLLEGFQDYLLVGIGINCNHDLSDFPTDLRMPASSISLETGKYLQREAVLLEVLSSIEKLLTPETAKSTIGEMNVLCETLGQAVCLDLGTEVIDGYAEKIDEFGRLVFVTQTGTRVVYSSQVVRTWTSNADASDRATS